MPTKFVVPVDMSQADATGPNIIDVDGAKTLQGDRIAVHDDGVLQGSVTLSQVDEDSGGIDTLPDVTSIVKGAGDAILLPDGFVGNGYAWLGGGGIFIVPSGGTAPYDYEALDPEGDETGMPPGVALAIGVGGTACQLSGDITGVDGPRDYKFRIKVTDADGIESTSTYMIHVWLDPTFQITAVYNSGGIVGAVYGGGQVIASGGIGPLVYTIGAEHSTPDPLPTGIALNSANGLITGTPSGSAGTVATSFKVTDAVGNTCYCAAAFTITDPAVTPFTAVNNRAFTAQAVTTAGGEVRSAAFLCPAVVGGKLRVAASGTITAGTPVHAFKLYKCATSGGTYVDTGLTITGFTGASSSISDVSAAGLDGLYLKLGDTVSGSAAAALTTADISIAGHS